MPGPADFGDQIEIRSTRRFVLHRSEALPFGEVGIYFVLVGKIIGESSVHLFQGQSRIAFHHALGRYSFSE